jgi:hypothetical protein
MKVKKLLIAVVTIDHASDLVVDMINILPVFYNDSITKPISATESEL